MPSSSQRGSREPRDESVWGRATSRERRTLKQLIYRLRHKLEHDPGVPQILQTTLGAGYKLLVD